MGAALAGLLLAVFGIDLLLSPAKTLKITLFHPYRRDEWPTGRSGRRQSSGSTSRVRGHPRRRSSRAGTRSPRPPAVVDMSPPEPTGVSAPTPRSRRRRATRSSSSRCTPRCIEHVTNRRPRSRGRRTMPIDTPAWVRDAVFYQIFPDRFAASDRVDKPGRLEPWDFAADGPWLQGRGPPWYRGAPRLSRGSRDQRALPDADLPVGRQPSIPHVRLPDGRPAARRERGAAPAARCRTRPRDPGRARWRVQSHRSRLLAFPPHPRERCCVAISRWFHLDDAASMRARRSDAYAEPGTRSAPFGYRAWWGLPALPKLNTDNPEVREFLFRVAEHWLLFGIDGWRLDVPAEIDDEAFWQEFRERCRAIRSDAYLVGEIWREAPDWLRGDRFDAVMNYPLAEAILGYAGGASLDLEVVRPPSRIRGWTAPARRTGVRRPGHRADVALPPRRGRRPAQPAWVPRRTSDADRPRR